MVAYSTHLRLPMATVGQSSWATIHQDQAGLISHHLAGTGTQTATGGTYTLADVDRTKDAGKAFYINVTGTLTSNANIVVPTRRKVFLVYNNTSGAFTLTVKTSGGTGVSVKQGYRQWVYCDGTNVIAISRLDQRATATELGLAVVTTSHLAANAVTATKITASGVILTKIAGGSVMGGSYGALLYTATGSGFPWTLRARGSANQELAMSTDTNPVPKWRTSAFRAIATSTGITFSANSTVSYTHGLTGLTNKYDYKLIVVMLVCTSADGGYSAGDVLYFGGPADMGSPMDTGLQMLADSLTAVKVIVGSTSMGTFGKSTRSGVNLDETKWEMRIRVFV